MNKKKTMKQQQQQQQMTKQEKTLWWQKINLWFWGGLLAAIIVTSWYMVARPMFYTHDFLHGARIAEMARGIKEGVWPVIWSENFAWGYGMPLFEFYAPLPYFIGAIFSLLGLSVEVAAKMVFVLSSAVTFVGMYFWAREFSDEKIASLSGGLLTLAAYRGMDIFARGALSEIMAIAAVPWVFWGLTRLVRGKKNGIAVTVVGFVWLILSHNITTMLIAVSVILYVILMMTIEKKWRAEEIKKVSGRLLAAALLSLGLTTFYLLPAFFEQDYTQLKTWILQDYFDYRLHFVYPKQLLKDFFGYGGSGYGDNDGLSFFLGWAQWLLLVMTGGVAGVQIWQWRQKKEKRQKMATIILIAGGGAILAFNLWMTTYWSASVWQILAKLLAFAQFPWRFLGVAIAFVALVAPLGLQWLAKKRQTGVTIFLWGLLILTSWRYFIGDQTNNQNASIYYQESAAYIRTEMSQVMVDYLPQAFANEWQAVPVTEKWWQTPAENKEKVEMLAVLKDESQRKKYQVKAEEATTLELTIADYPEWQVKVNEVVQEKQISERGNLLVQIPAGVSIIEVKLEPTSLRFWCNLVSGITWWGVFGWIIYQIWQKRYKRD